MADRIPLIYNTSANQIQELGETDTIDLTGSNLNVGIATATVFSNPSALTGAVTLLDTGKNYFNVGTISVGAGSTLAVGVGVTYFVITTST